MLACKTVVQKIDDFLVLTKREDGLSWGRMKQITLAQARALALENKQRLYDEIKYCQADWVRDHGRHIADIETKRADKTYFGEFPKGWKSEMLRASKETAEANLLARFLRDECKQLDGAIWCGNWQIIQRLERRGA